MVNNFEIAELEMIEAPSAARDFIEGFAIGLGIIAFFCGGC